MHMDNGLLKTIGLLETAVWVLSNILLETITHIGCLGNALLERVLWVLSNYFYNIDIRIFFFLVW